MERQELIPHLFRTEFSKIATVLCKSLGIDNISAAEDIAGDTFLLALETWPYKGVPENPIAWLYAVAKNKAKNQIARNRLFNARVSVQVVSLSPKAEEPEIDLSEKNISDSMLQMLFTLCHPAIPVESQIALSLRILCGFGIDEIATAFLTNKDTINKRLYRAKEKLRQDKIPIKLPADAEIGNRLDTVLTTLYLLFSEGYYSESYDMALREDLCLEAMRLTYMLATYDKTNMPQVNALLALMCFHASRFKARKTQNGEPVLYYDQDESLWNHDLIKKGAYYLKIASQGDTFTKYHLEAAIAYWHTVKSDTQERWASILQLYDRLLAIQYSPVAALNRTYAFAKVHGTEKAISEAKKLNLDNNPYYFTLLGELYGKIDKAEAGDNFIKALSLAKTNHDRQAIRKKIDAL